MVVLPAHATLRWKSRAHFYRCRFYFPVAMLRASSLVFCISPLWKNRARREAGDPKCRHDECTVLQMHPNSLSAVHVCEGSTAGKFCQYSAHIRKIKGSDFFSFLSLGVWFYISSLLHFFPLEKSYPPCSTSDKDRNLHMLACVGCPNVLNNKYQWPPVAFNTTAPPKCAPSRRASQSILHRAS